MTVHYKHAWYKQALIVTLSTLQVESFLVINELLVVHVEQHNRRQQTSTCRS